MSLRPTNQKLVQDRSSPAPTTTGVRSGRPYMYRLASLFLFKVLSAFRPITPQLVPFVVFLLFVPLLALLSLSAGWIVWHTVAVNWDVDVYLQYGDDIPPYALVNLPTLVPQQAYDISLHLVIPACESNFALGNFMTTLTISTLANDTLATVRRPTIVHSSKIHYWPFLSGQANIVDFDVALLDSFAPEVSNILAYIQLGRQDGWKSIGHGEGREISVLSASLKGVVRHQGFRGLITRFPLFVSFVSVFAFFSVTCIILGACFFTTIVRRTGDEVTWTETPTTPITPVELVEKQLPAPQLVKDEDEKPPGKLRRLRRSRSRSTEDTLVFKTEVSSSDSPFQSPVRRRSRRSRASDGEV